MKQKSLWLGCLIASLFYTYVSIEMTIFDTLASSIMEAFHFNAIEYSQISSLFLLGMLIFLIPAGMLLDKLPIKNTLLICVICSSLLVGVFAVTHSVIFLKFINFFLGLLGA